MCKVYCTSVVYLHTRSLNVSSTTLYKMASSAVTINVNYQRTVNCLELQCRYYFLKKYEEIEHKKQISRTEQKGSNLNYLFFNNQLFCLVSKSTREKQNNQ